ncbi:MAG: anaerobic ribonucleoside-triphosphate reductase activating protein [Candidatus Gastranaerophilales bacterium]|nr:anaerobic ribonucleoside-triphosphate reductase activating protein [Candidatus Gastranaerophilales bacterium]
MKIGAYQKVSFIDYPDKLAAIVFTQGCNFRCPYCHNPELIDKISDNLIQEDEFFKFLKNRQKKLDGVVITGGEPTLQKDLSEFIEKIKKLGFLIKLDTNGTNPDILQELTENNLIDYIAMDIKAPLEKYDIISKNKSLTPKIAKSIELIINSNFDYEFRTTVEKTLLSKEDILKIGEQINGAKKYYLQKFIVSKHIDENFINAQTYTDEEFEHFKKELRKTVQLCEIR